MSELITTSFTLATYSQGNPDEKRLALVLPGRLDTKDYVHMKSAVDFLATKGYFAVSFDPPGTWESPGGIELFTTTNYLKAVNELIEYFGARPTVLFGHSRGGTTAMLASDNPAVIAIAMVMATYGKPSSPTPEAIAAGFLLEPRDLPPGDRRDNDKPKTFRLPLNYFKDGKLFNPVAELEHCTKPKLLIYGTKDKFTAISKVKEVFQGIPNPKILHELHTDHDYRYSPEAIKEVNKIVGKFLNEFCSE